MCHYRPSTTEVRCKLNNKYSVVVIHNGGYTRLCYICVEAAKLDPWQRSLTVNNRNVTPSHTCTPEGTLYVYNVYIHVCITRVHYYIYC